MWLLITFMLACGPKKDSATAVTPEVVPAEERTQQGPTESRGISAVENLGAIDLRTEFTGFEEQTIMRLRRLTVDSGGAVAEHTHQFRPGIAYILTGEIVEVRGEEAVLKKDGDHALEATGTTHWWENRSDAASQAVVVDILVPEKHQEIPALLAIPPKGDFPTENVGISNVEVVNTHDLTKEHPSLAGKVLRTRRIEVAPDGIVGFHVHQSRPGFAYILEGEMKEYRPGMEKPLSHPKGSLAVERNCVAHWWKNESSNPSLILVVDIYTPE
jgi:quercetin dioxygenase-like cupin family protein